MVQAPSLTTLAAINFDIGDKATMSERLTKVEFTNLDKILFPQLKITKAQVVEYYIKIAPKMLGFLVDRPLVLTRFPSGVDKEGKAVYVGKVGTGFSQRTLKVLLEAFTFSGTVNDESVLSISWCKPTSTGVSFKGLVYLCLLCI